MSGVGPAPVLEAGAAIGPAAGSSLQPGTSGPGLGSLGLPSLALPRVRAFAAHHGKSLANPGFKYICTEEPSLVHQNLGWVCSVHGRGPSHTSAPVAGTFVDPDSPAS